MTRRARNDSDVQQKTAVEFLEWIVAGTIDQAYRKHVAMDGKHLNPFFPPGFPALQKAMKEDCTGFPSKRIRIIHVIAKDALVSAHSHIRVGEDDKEFQAGSIFRLLNGRIAELWDCRQAVPADSPNSEAIA